MQPTAPTTDAAKAELLNANSVWGPYLARKFFLPALSHNGPEEWREVYSLFGTNIAQLNHDQYPQAWCNTSDNTDNSNNDGAHFTIDIAQPEHLPQSQPGPSSVVHGATGWLNLDSPFGTYNSQPNHDYFNNDASRPPRPPATPSTTTLPSLWDQLLPRSPNNHTRARRALPLSHSTTAHQSSSIHVTPHLSPKLGNKRQPSSFDADVDHFLGEHERAAYGRRAECMIWGMKVDDYRALSAKERRRVRNRISARTFRAKRREHIASLESTVSVKDLQINLANEEASRLHQEVAELKRRLAIYETLWRGLVGVPVTSHVYNRTIR